MISTVSIIQKVDKNLPYEDSQIYKLNTFFAKVNKRIRIIFRVFLIVIVILIALFLIYVILTGNFRIT